MHPALYRLCWKDRRGRLQERVYRLYPDEVEEAALMLATLVGRLVWIAEVHVASLEELREEWRLQGLERASAPLLPPAENARGSALPAH